MLRLLALTVGGCLLLAAGLLCMRRLAGALTEPLGTSELTLAALSAATAQVAARVLWRQGAAAAAVRGIDVAFQGLLSAALVALAAAASLPGSAPAGLAILWLLALVAEAAGWRLILPRRARRVPLASPVQGEGPQDENLAQRITRRQMADGAEEVHGWLMASLESGQRQACAHVAFCPPLDGTPEVRVRQTAGPLARVKTGQVLPYGARFDIKLEHPTADPAAVRLEFTATYPRP